MSVTTLLTRRLVPSAALLLSASLAAAQGPQQVVPAQSEIGFTSKQMGVPVDGKFRKWDAQMSFDPKKLEASRVAFTIDTGSASFGSPETDAEVPKAAWFNAAKFPQATFQSSGIKAVGGNKYEVAGKLTIKGSVRDVVVPVALAQAGAVTTATGAFTIKRLDFKIGEGEWADTSMVANDVQVKFKLAVTGIGPL
ncbi:YceI family protein [Ideonella sp. YS5]|uniref:YceI family protein n=1 Tax=Ideonella sp. YS5 TaxID=3453714 RepID=UPI003EE9B54B